MDLNLLPPPNGRLSAEDRAHALLLLSMYIPDDDTRKKVVDYIKCELVAVAFQRPIEREDVIRVVREASNWNALGWQHHMSIQSMCLYFWRRGYLP